jgi:hypothetical protein
MHPRHKLTGFNDLVMTQFTKTNRGEECMKNSKWWTLGVVLLLGAVLAGAQQQGTTGPKVNPSAVQKKAQAAPPANATPTSSVGTQAKMATPGAVSWSEQLDVDGNGQAEQATLTWDAKDKVLVSDSSGTFTCSNGDQGSGELLIAVNAKGNLRNRPAGSGFWAASLNKGQCGAQSDTLWGCKFDASGNPTACGAAQIDEKDQDLTIVTAQPGS